MFLFDKISIKEAAILAAIGDRELYGLEIPEAVEEVSGGEVKIRLGYLYPSLHHLESKGLIKSRWGEEADPSRNKARRQYYSLTDDGVVALNPPQENNRDDQS